MSFEETNESRPWLLPFLARIRTRPGMYLGAEEVETLYLYMTGYEQGRADVGFVGMALEDAVLLVEFEFWMTERANWKGDRLRWPGLIREVDPSLKNTHTFFKLFEEFLRTKGRSLDSVTPWVPRGRSLPRAAGTDVLSEAARLYVTKAPRDE